MSHQPDMIDEPTQTDDRGADEEPADECEECGATGVPLRNIKMRGADRELLCEECFRDALEERRVSTHDPRHPECNHA